MNCARACKGESWSRLLKTTAILLAFSIAFQPVSVLPTSAAGNVYYVAPCGDDQNTGQDAACGSASGPFRTIQAAASRVRAGDTVKILPGVYRETVTISASGTVDAPITFEAANGPGTAFIYGSENARSFAWRDEGNGVYSTEISQLPRPPEIVYELGVASNAFDGQPNYPEITFFREMGDGIVKYPKAHEPDFTVNTPWKYHENWATADGGIGVWDDAAARAQCPSSPQNAFLDCMSTKEIENSSLYYMTDRNIGGDGLDLRQYPNLVGAVVYMLDTKSAFYIYRREIASFSQSEGKIGWTDRADFDYMTGNPAIGPFTKYYIEGKRQFLDRPMEWFVEAGRLYIKTRTGGSPNTLDIEIATRDKGIVFSNQSRLTFRNLSIYFINNALRDDFDGTYGEGALLALNNSGTSDYITMDAVTIAHSGKAIKLFQPNISKGLLSQHVTLKNSEIFDIEGVAFANPNYGWADGQTGAFPYLTIDGNHIHHIGFKPTIWAPYGLRFPDAYKLVVTNNYIHDTAHKCMQITKTRGEYILVKDNYLERCGLNHSEASGVGIQHWGHVFTTTLFMGNVVRGNRGWTYASANNYWDGGKNYNGVGFYRGMSGIGLNQDGGDGIRIYRNILIDNSMLCVAASPGYKFNNICIGSNEGFSAGYTYSPEDFPFVVENNIFLDNYIGINTYPTDPGGPTIDYNLYEQARSIRDNPRNSWNLPGHLAYPVANRSTAQNTYGRVCDPADQADSICYNTPWEDHGVENDHQAIFVDPTDLTTASIFTLKAKLALAPSSKALDAGIPPTDMQAVVAELGKGLGIEIEDEQPQGAAYDIGPFEYQGSPPRPPAEIPRAPWRPSVDGLLHEYGHVPGFEFADQSGRGQQDNRTIVKAIWDDKDLHLGIQVADTQLKADVSERDGAVWSDDAVEVFIDPLLNGGSSFAGDDYRIAVNLLNAIADSREGFNNHHGWDGTAYSQVALNGTLNEDSHLDVGYTLELAIPWADLRVVPVPGTEIGLDVAVDDRDDEASGYQYSDWAGLADFNRPAAWGRILLSAQQADLPIFADVPFDHPYLAEIVTLYENGYTAGCSTDPLMYCPDRTMNRAESAVFVERGIHGTGGLPPQPTSQTFADLPLDSWAAKWAEALWQDRYTAGCGTDPLVYCPWQGHTRAEGCVFYLHMLHGPDYAPPQPTQQTFADVPLEAWYAKWVQAGYDAGLLEPCQTTPDLRFCPNDPLSRALAAYMMVQAKGLNIP